MNWGQYIQAPVASDFEIRICRRLSIGRKICVGSLWKNRVRGWVTIIQEQRCPDRAGVIASNGVKLGKKAIRDRLVLDVIMANLN